jgi:molybdate transport system substrate-binding protein
LNIPGRTRYIVAVACFALFAAACGKATKSTAPASTPSATPSLTGSANIFAAASLTSAFNKIITDFTAQHPGVKLTPNYNGSDTLVTQIKQGAPADVFASADTTNMDKLTRVGLVPTSTVHIFARNKLQVIVAKGNPKGIKTLADLAKPGVAVVLENPSVPAGKYAAQAMATAGVTVTAKSLETSVTAVVQKVALGEADAGIVYVTDVATAVAQHEPVEGVDIPTPPNVVATYPIGIVKAAPNPALATAFEDYVLSPPGQADLTSFGFLPPS